LGGFSAFRFQLSDFIPHPSSSFRLWTPRASLLCTRFFDPTGNHFFGDGVGHRPRELDLAACYSFPINDRNLLVLKLHRPDEGPDDDGGAATGGDDVAAGDGVSDATGGVYLGKVPASACLTNTPKSRVGV